MKWDRDDDVAEVDEMSAVCRNLDVVMVVVVVVEGDGMDNDNDEKEIQ